MQANATVSRPLGNSTSPALIRLSAGAENALSAALHLLRNPAATAGDLQRAAARAGRAADLLRQAFATQAEGAAS